MVIPFHINTGGNLIENIRKNTWHWLNRTFSTASCSRIFNFISICTEMPLLSENPLFLISSHLFTRSIHLFTIYSSFTGWQEAQPIPVGTGLKRWDILEAILQCINAGWHAEEKQRSLSISVTSDRKMERETEREIGAKSAVMQLFYKVVWLQRKKNELPRKCVPVNLFSIIVQVISFGQRLSRIVNCKLLLQR